MSVHTIDLHFTVSNRPIRVITNDKKYAVILFANNQQIEKSLELIPDFPINPKNNEKLICLRDRTKFEIRPIKLSNRKNMV